MTSILQAFAVGAVTIGAGAATVTTMKPDLPDLAIPDMAWEAGSALDGRVFYTTDKVRETNDVLNDELHFVDGQFQSAMCQDYCDFGWSGYQTWTDGETLHFTATTRCPNAPHTVVWYGTVTGDNVQFEGTWTTRRWYWTRQLNVSGEGSLTPHPQAASG
jgi:hypothetical protein